MAKSKNETTKKNACLVRIANDDTLTFIEELYQTGLFNSKNEILNKCLDIGILELAKRHLRHRKFDKTDTSQQSTSNIESTSKEMIRLLKQVEANTDDMFIILNLIKHVMTMLLNIKAEELDGESVSKHDLTSGRFSDLPEYLQEIEDDILKRFIKT